MTDVAALPYDDLRDLVNLVVPVDATEPMGVYLFGSDDMGAALARHVEGMVFAEAFGNTPEILAEEYGPYEASSIFFCVIDHRRRLPVGMARVVLPAPDGSGLKTFDDIEPIWGISAEELIRRNGLSLPRPMTWDLATLAVDSAYRRAAAAGLISMALYQSITMSAQRCLVDWGVAILDLPVHRMMRRILRGMFNEFDGTPPRPYLGSEASLPVWTNHSEWKRHLLEVDPDLHDVVFNGVGLGPAMRVLDPIPNPQLLAWSATQSGARRGGRRL